MFLRGVVKSEFNTQPGVGNSTCGFKGLTFTNTLNNGTQAFGILSCNNWTSNAAGTLTGGGHWSSSNNNWTQYVCGYACQNLSALYCFQQ